MDKQYDIFLSHNSADKAAVEQIARRLSKAGLNPFLDKWHLIPGEPWQEAIEDALQLSATTAVFLGPSGIGPWHNEEMRDALQIHSGDKNYRVIPVLLPGASPPESGETPRFIARFTWVDFRNGLDDADAFHRLIAGIRGQVPGRRPTDKPSKRQALEDEQKARLKSILQQAETALKNDDLKSALINFREALNIQSGNQQAKSGMRTALIRLDISRLYEQALLYEQAEQLPKALHRYRLILERSSAYRDVPQRVAAIETILAEQPSQIKPKAIISGWQQKISSHLRAAPRWLWFAIGGFGLIGLTILALWGLQNLLR